MKAALVRLGSWLLARFGPPQDRGWWRCGSCSHRIRHTAKFCPLCGWYRGTA